MVDELKIKVASFDPSIRNFGIAIAEVDLEKISIDIQSIHLIETKAVDGGKKYKTSGDILKAAYIHKEVAKYVQDVDMIMTEIPVGSQSAGASWYFGMVVGMLAFYQCNNTLIELTPKAVKSVVGGNPSKREMIDWAYGLYPHLEWYWHGKRLQNKNEHMADAIAVLHAGIESEDFADSANQWLEVNCK